MVQSLMVLFFHLRFGVSLVSLSVLFFAANLLSALSFLAAVPLARRFGLLNTMVFTHLPSNVLLILVAFAPTFPVAVVLLLLRQALSQMDVPTRQAYTMALVAPDERTAAASVTSLSRSVGSATSPVWPPTTTSSAYSPRTTGTTTQPSASTRPPSRSRNGSATGPALRMSSKLFAVE